ncbi:hypothetical protein BV378_20300 [Nostoc sp. RF31YmG]|jgi:hypothetical protein|nr:hypothetical protein BV378_20300 [Nostoc sp. RF31YmG]
MTIMFKKATKSQIKLRLALVGISGSGKTYTALNTASHLGKSVAVIDTEHRSASKYADLFNFDTCELTSFHPQNYIDAITAASGYDVLIIDSLSHAWMGKDGALEQVDRIAKRSQTSNTFAAWRDVTPLHNQLVEAMLSCPCHLIVTMRSKSDYVMEEYEDKGKKKTRPVKVGLAPIQRDGVEYEFDVVGDMDKDNNLIITKSRCPNLSGQVIHKPAKELAYTLRAWMGEPWILWKSEDDAIAWASKQLPDIKLEQLREEFNNLSPSNGKKAPAWVERVMQFKEPF